MRHVYCFTIVILFALVGCAHAYTDSVDKYSIKFPRGWVVSRQMLSDGTHITSAEDPNSYAKILVQVTNGGINPDLVRNREFVKFATTKMLPFARTQCPEPVPTGAHNVNFAKRDSLSLSFACLDDSIVVLYIIPTKNNGYMLSYVGPKNIAITHGIETAINSFKILR